MCLYSGFFCLSWPSFASLPQLNSLLQVRSGLAMNCTPAGKQKKAKKGRSHYKDTGMLTFIFLTITSFPATHDQSCANLDVKFCLVKSFSSKNKENARFVVRKRGSDVSV